MTDLSHPLAKARGHGSARSGVHHWIAQRVSAVILLFLVPWVLYSLVCLAGQPYPEVERFVASPWNAALLILFTLSVLYHSMLGLQVVIEDYVHQTALEIILQLVVRVATCLAAIVSLIYFLKPVLGA